MDSSQSSGSVSHSRIKTEDKSFVGPPCRCGRPTKVLKAWTNENPGRRFYSCVVHGFSSWYDVEEPHGWQKVSLLEARAQIQAQRTEIQNLKESIRSLRQQESSVVTAEADNFGSSPSTNLVELKKSLEDEVLKVRERERMLRQFLLISWGGFLVATAIILTMSK